jgi:fumarate reductase subunit C
MKPYIRQMPASWWLKRTSYLLFMLRELSSVFVGGYVVIFLMMIRNLSRGPAEYEAFMAMLRSPVAILFHVVALAFALLHTITWFNLTPKAMAVWKGEERLPPAMMIIPNYVGWVVVSGIIAWVVLAG